MPEATLVDVPEPWKGKISAILVGVDWKLERTETEVPSWFGVGTLYLHHYQLKHVSNGIQIAWWKLLPMPGCCGVCISTAGNVQQSWKGKGLGGLLNSLRIELAKGQKYGLLLCTDLSANEPSVKLLQRNGWKKVHEFRNPRTSRLVGMHLIDLGPREPSLSQGPLVAQ